LKLTNSVIEICPSCCHGCDGVVSVVLTECAVAR
jgi:hypothetical protein